MTTKRWRSLGTACCSCATPLLPWMKPGSLTTRLLVPHVLCGFVMSSCTKFVTSMFPDWAIWIAQPCLLLTTSEQSGSNLGNGLFRPLNYDCRVLQLLWLEDCVLVDLKEISSRSLKVLHIINCLITGSLLICASNLTHLSILDMHSHSGAILVRDLSSLVTAFVSVRTIEGHALLDGLSHATTLELHAPLPERGLWICPMFSNLTSLVLGHCCMAADFDALLRILQRSPKLKELIFKLERVQCIRCMHSESTLPPSGAALSLGPHPCIERIKICCSKEDPNVGALVEALQPIVGDVKISIKHLY
ncbi:hypothetical protein VPH35_094431 [Triticum aestivum]